MAKETETAPPMDWCLAGTLAWFGVLGRPLSLAELRRRLLRRGVSVAELERAAKKLGRKVTERDGDYTLTGLEVRYPQAGDIQWQRHKWWRVRLAVGLLQYVPFVRTVAVANTLADGSADADSDIDLFIIIERGRLFLARTIITGLLQLAGLRRHGRKIKNRICLSFFITTDHLDLHPIAFKPYDIYLNYWIADLVPVLDDGETFKEFQRANRWVGLLVPGFASRPANPVKPNWVAGAAAWLLRRLAADYLERRLARWQLERINRKATSKDPDVQIIASEQMLKFHEKERRRTYREAWEEVMRERGFDPERILR